KIDDSTAVCDGRRVRKGGAVMAEPKCPRCLCELSVDDVVESDGANVVHVDCQRPRDLTRQERALLFGYCWAHPIECPPCGESFELFRLEADPSNTTRGPAALVAKRT